MNFFNTYGKTIIINFGKVEKIVIILCSKDSWCVLVTWKDNTCWVSVILSINFFEFSSVICLLVTYLYRVPFK